MNNSLYGIQLPKNEPIHDYLPGSKQSEGLQAEIKRQSSMQVDIPIIIGGKEIRTGDTGKVTMPHNHGHTIATYHKAGPKEVEMAIKAALEAKEQWMELSWLERSAITLKAAELISTKYRNLVNASTIIGQGKNFYQSEIDAICESVDFIRFNTHYASELYKSQPASTADQFNRTEYRPLEGFVFVVTPFNFTAIASNLNLTVALMGNTIVWKPSTTSLLSNYYLTQIFKEAGLPPGVLNFVPGNGAQIGDIVLDNFEYAGLNFTGSTKTFRTLWQKSSQNLEKYRNYPRISGETGGKDFIFIHSSADAEAAAVALMRGSFEFQGQKCSACSRTYIPKSLWPKIKESLLNMVNEVKMGDPTDQGNFINAVIDETSWKNIMYYIGEAKKNPDCEIIAGGEGDNSKGWFVKPTIIVTKDPNSLTIREEIFGPVLTVFVYDDKDYIETLELCNRTSPYGLTGSIFAQDRYAAVEAFKRLRYAAGNFYYNDKCTGAMVGMQPFGGARASGTNDKAGGPHNLLRWVAMRTIKETYAPPTDYRYGYMM